MKFRNLLVAAVAVAMVGMLTQSSEAQLANNLFNQYETAGASSATAGMYPAPHYVPYNVGASYYTYQPLQPHEMMYTHSRRYFNVYGGPENFYANQCNGRGGGAGLNVTTVKWQNGCQHMGPLPGTLPFASINDALARYWYCRRSGGRGCSRFLPRGGGYGGCASGNCGGESYGYAEGGCASGNCAVKPNQPNQPVKR